MDSKRKKLHLGKEGEREGIKLVLLHHFDSKPGANVIIQTRFIYLHFALKNGDFLIKK